MSGLLSRIMPHDQTFFEMFVDLGEAVQAGARALVILLENYTNPLADAERIKEIEHHGDTLTHNIIRRLNQTFVTPFDREDIHELTSKIDDVLDLINAVASRLVTYRVDRIRPGVNDLARIVLQATNQVVQALRVLEKQNHILDHCIEINRLENEADQVSRKLIAELFDSEQDPVQIIKWKEIIEVLEIAADKCEDVANVIETVALKSA